MSKRFTDTEKWKRPWYRQLPLKAKIVWQYLCDDCNHAGIWFGDFELLSFQVNFKVSHEDLSNWFDEKIVKIGDKYFIPSFFDFQYKTTKDNFSAKKSALRILRDLGLVDENMKFLNNIGGGGDSGGTLLESTSIGISIIKGIGKSKRAFDFEKIYESYPLKKGKSKGIEKCKSQIKTDEDYSNLEKAVASYKALCEKEETESQYIKQFSTFMGCWRDYLDENIGHSLIAPKGEGEIKRGILCE